jgi:hypothetical protein
MAQTTSVKKQANNIARCSMTSVHVLHAIPLAKNQGGTVAFPAVQKHEY